MGTIIVSEIEYSEGICPPLVKFSYQVNVQKWTGDKVFFGEGQIFSSNYKYFNKVVNKYPVKTIVNVFYHPSKPNIAVLEPGVTQKMFIQFGFGSIFFVIGFSHFFAVFVAFIFDYFNK